jgi:hypothetical protein
MGQNHSQEIAKLNPKLMVFVPLHTAISHTIALLHVGFMWGETGGREGKQPWQGKSI